jgi:tRNA threonylcarbamoyl adenosine modification protein YeaZ
MITLFIDTHGEMLNLGIVKNNVLLKEIKELSFMEHSSKTLPYIEKMYNELNIKPNEIDKIMVVNGPGSFTGLRIGVTIAKTYGYSLNKDVIPISSLKASALSYDNYDYIVVMIDAKRDFYFAGIYDKEYNNVINDQYISKENLDIEINKLNGKILKITDDKDLKILKIVNYYQNEKGINPHSLVPDYLKETYIEKK